MERKLMTMKTLTHIAESGKAQMVDVSEKVVSRRQATAIGKVWLGQPAFDLVAANQLKKGDVLGVAKISGIQAAKQTSMLIPLCHPLLLTQIKVDCTLNTKEECIDIESTVTCEGQTGVEMEAITAVSIAACTIYDMAKAVNKGIIIKDIRLKHKTGGKSGDFHSY